MAAPELAARLSEVHDEMNFAERMDLSDDHDLDWARHLDQRHTMARRRREILAEIRELPGFADFLRPPRCETLRQAAEAGPVVVLNVSRYGCDALIVTLDEVRAVPLGFSLPEARRQADRFAQALRAKAVDEVDEGLRWLWENVTGPVLTALGPLSRIWWCPTGPLTLLPLHAAGSALDLVVSSYTPTLRALRHARDQTGPKAARRVLLVGVPAVPGEAALTGVARELAAVRRHIPESYELKGDDATHERVLAALEQGAWVHFACHAEQELADPSRARLILRDRPLTVRELAARR